MKFAFFSDKLKNLSLNFGLMLTKTSFIVFNIFLGQLGYIVMSDSKKKSKYLFFEKQIRFTPFFVARTKSSGVEVIASYSVGFCTFIYFKIYLYLNTI